MEDSIYNLKLHEILDVNEFAGRSIQVQRVPGGWNYIYQETIYGGIGSNSRSISISTVFVPFNDEFQDDTK